MMNEKIKALDMKNAFSPPQVHLISEFNEPGIPNSLNFKKSDKFIAALSTNRNHCLIFRGIAEFDCIAN